MNFKEEMGNSEYLKNWIQDCLNPTIKFSNPMRMDNKMIDYKVNDDDSEKIGWKEF